MLSSSRTQQTGSSGNNKRIVSQDFGISREPLKAQYHLPESSRLCPYVHKMARLTRFWWKNFLEKTPWYAVAFQNVEGGGGGYTTNAFTVDSEYNFGFHYLTFWASVIIKNQSHEIQAEHFHTGFSLCSHLSESHRLDPRVNKEKVLKYFEFHGISSNDK